MNGMVTVKQIAGVLAEKPARVSYALMKLDAHPADRVGTIRFFRPSIINSIRQAIAGFRRYDYTPPQAPPQGIQSLQLHSTHEKREV